MILQDILRSIYFEEGKKKYPYPDTKGIWTIDIGFTTVYGIKVTESTKPLTKSESRDNLYMHLGKAVSIANKFVDNFDSLTHVRQLILVNMAYQMGYRLHDFIETRKLIQRRRWKASSIEMLDSKWYREDTPNRAVRMSSMFASNKLYKYPDQSI